jgi:cytochrome c553
MRMSLRAAALAALAATSFPLVAQQTAAPPPAPAFAESNLAPEGVRSMASACASCHGPNGRSARDSSVPGLAARPAAEIVEAMAQFKDGKRPATLMHQIAKGYTDAEVAAIADYFSKQAR